MAAAVSISCLQDAVNEHTGYKVRVGEHLEGTLVGVDAHATLYSLS